MKILFTGGSSFTGYWFVRELSHAGHEVVATLRRKRDAYEGTRRMRVEALYELCDDVVEECSFGDERFAELITAGGWAVLCHHGAETTDYKDPRFDALKALESNVHNLRATVDGMAVTGCRRIVLTGSVFEADEGSGDGENRPAFSAYGLSKTLTYQAFRFHAGEAGLRLGKFVIPNPFGPLEEPRFTSYLLTSWLRDEVPVVRTPEYVRDNIHVSLLARAYVAFVTRLSEEPGITSFNPSGYRGSQHAFSARVAREMEPRFSRPCLLEFTQQTEFPEPRVRVNTDELDAGALEWSESKAWDDLAEFYLAQSHSTAPTTAASS